MRRTLFILPVILLLAASTTTRAQEVPAVERWQRAWVAWDEGDYIPALENMIAIMSGPASGEFHERIALLTGELYQTTELSPDGGAVRFDPSGRWAVYEKVEGPETITHLVDLAARGRPETLIRGRGVAVSADGAMAAWFVVVETPEVSDLRARLAEAERAGDNQARREHQAALRQAEEASTRLVVRRLAGGDAVPLRTAGIVPQELAFLAADRLALIGRDPETGGSGLYLVRTDGRALGTISTGHARLSGLTVIPDGAFALCAAGAAGGRGGGGGGAELLLVDLAGGDVRSFEGRGGVLSREGSKLSFMRTREGMNEVVVVDLSNGAESVLVSTAERLDSPALSPDGGWIAWMEMVRGNWEIFAADVADPAPVRITREIQHDLYPQFVNEQTLLAVIGEGRHRRSHLYDVATGERTRLFHNNTVRTIAPEYSWSVAPGGHHVLIVSERDGDTISPERGVYLVDLEQRVGAEELMARLVTELAGERALRREGQAMFAPVADDVAAVTEQVSMTWLYEYQKQLFDFDSKNISQPGNEPAREYIGEVLASFGYEPEYQWFDARGRGGSDPIRTANVLATLKGSTNPELVYVLSSHFDSNARGPGADDNSTGVAVLLEAARVLADYPMPATIIFAAFTGEESGLLGSREYVRQAVENGIQLMGALNNDMIGWSGDHRLDNTIRYSNAGIRDVQHAAAFLFSDLITYDAHYYKSTDAAAYYDAYGDIVGGIGSYHVLGNPYYHQPTDLLETINHELVAETTRTTVASLMLLASSPSRLNGVEASVRRGGAEVTWIPSPEKDVTGYEVVWGPAENPAANSMRVDEPRAVLQGAGEGTVVAVRAWNGRGLHGWDWARLTVGR